jgi:hypothetical protein
VPWCKWMYHCNVDVDYSSGHFYDSGSSSSRVVKCQWRVPPYSEERMGRSIPAPTPAPAPVQHRLPSGAVACSLPPPTAQPQTAFRLQISNGCSTFPSLESSGGRGRRRRRRRQETRNTRLCASITYWHTKGKDGQLTWQALLLLVLVLFLLSVDIGISAFELFVSERLLGADSGNAGSSEKGVANDARPLPTILR